MSSLQVMGIFTRYLWRDKGAMRPLLLIPKRSRGHAQGTAQHAIDAAYVRPERSVRPLGKGLFKALI